MTKEEAIAVLQEEIDGNLELTIREWRERDEQRLFPALRMAIKALSDRPTGEWTNKGGEPIKDKFCVYCSKCKEWSEYRTNYCGNCGSKMKGGAE